MVKTPDGGCRGFHLTKRNAWVGFDQVIAVDFGENGTVELRELRSLQSWASVDCLTDLQPVLDKLLDWVRSYFNE